jgi:hypothetical protein
MKPEDIPLDPGSFAIAASDGAWRPFPHLRLVIEILLYVVQGRLSRVMFFLPPRHGKSELISHYFLTWFLGHFPDMRIILATHTANFSRKWGRRARNLIKKVGSKLFPKPIELAEDSTAAGAWDIKGHHGGLFTSGVSGSILGEGANGFIIDDPTKGFRKARSKTHQEELNDWWTTEAKTRLQAAINKGTKPWVIGIWQRLNKKDLSGQILESEPSMDFHKAIEILRSGGSIPYGTWVVVNLPAISKKNDPLGREEGEPLWPEMKSLKELQQIKKEMGSFRFEAVYQGEPRDPEGGVFKRWWFKNSKMPLKDILAIVKNLPHLRYWDLAASGEEGDAAAGLLTAWDGEYLYIIKLNHGKYTPSRMLREFENTALKDTKAVHIRVEQEGASSPKILIQKFRQSKKLKGFKIRSDKVTGLGDKVVRSFDFQALCEDDKVRIADNIYDLVVEECVEFTGEEGGEDNIVDTCGGSARYWTRAKRKVIA